MPSTGDKRGQVPLHCLSLSGGVIAHTVATEMGSCPVIAILVAVHQHVPLPSWHGSPTHLHCRYCVKV